jgi:predicted nuclease with TOPRIM domain
MGTLKTRLRIELKSKSNKHPMEQLNLENFDFQDENAIREKIIETHRNNIILKKQVTELNSHNSTLQNRLLKEQEKSKLNPKITMGVPTSVEVLKMVFIF